MLWGYKLYGFDFSNFFWKLGQGAAQKCGVSRSPVDVSEKFQKQLIANQGSPIRWSRDQWSLEVTRPTFWKLGQGAAQKCDVSRSLMVILEKIQIVFLTYLRLGNSFVIFHVVTAIALLSLIPNIKQQKESSNFGGAIWLVCRWAACVFEVLMTLWQQHSNCFVWHLVWVEVYFYIRNLLSIFV